MSITNKKILSTIILIIIVFIIMLIIINNANTEGFNYFGPNQRGLVERTDIGIEKNN